jgi:co-chaperonin GroES (HSP10)
MAFDPLKITSIRALNKDVIVTDMDFSEMTTASGIVIQSDDGKVHGIKPRWARVYKVGPKQQDIKVGEWILIEHGRWTRKLKIEDSEGVKEIQKIDVDCVLASADNRPNDLYFGIEYANGAGVDIRPEDFMR